MSDEYMLTGIDQLIEAEMARGHSLLDAQYRALLLLQRTNEPNTERWNWYNERIAGAREALRKEEAAMLVSKAADWDMVSQALEQREE